MNYILQEFFSSTNNENKIKISESEVEEEKESTTSKDKNCEMDISKEALIKENKALKSKNQELQRKLEGMEALLRANSNKMS